jgi:glc operon protein GlcG
MTKGAWMFGVLLAGAMSAAQAQTMDGKVLTLEGAKRVIEGAVTEAKRVSAPSGAITVVDAGGFMLAFERWDNTFPAAAPVSFGKAHTAALFRKQTKVFEDAINKGRTAMTALPDTILTPLQGGVPIMIDGQTVGAVGVSGAASAQQDEELAMAGVKALLEGIGAGK